MFNSIKKRKTFSEISPLTYKISALKCRLIRYIKNLFSIQKFAKIKSSELLPILIYEHNSLIRRQLGNVDLQLQENKAINLKLASEKITNIIIKPNETFSFWYLVGSCSEKKGYLEGMSLKKGNVSKAIGGGLCQLSNLIHWMVLHTPLEIVEHHHHDGIDLFPDYGRQVPFGTGTSVGYNYIDYRFKNTTDNTYQLIIYTTEKYLCGELRATERLSVKYHIVVENEYFTQEGKSVYRNNVIYRNCINIKTGNLLSKELIKTNHAKVMYDTSNINIKYV